MCDAGTRFSTALEVVLSCAARAAFPEGLSPSWDGDRVRDCPQAVRCHMAGMGTGYRAATHDHGMPTRAWPCVLLSHVWPSLLPRSVITEPQGSCFSLDITLRAPKAGMAPVSPKSTRNCFYTVWVTVLCPQLPLTRRDERASFTEDDVVSTLAMAQDARGGLMAVVGQSPVTSSASARLCKLICKTGGKEVFSALLCFCSWSHLPKRVQKRVLVMGWSRGAWGDWPPLQVAAAACGCLPRWHDGRLTNPLSLLSPV